MIVIAFLAMTLVGGTRFTPAKQVNTVGGKYFASVYPPMAMVEPADFISESIVDFTPPTVTKWTELSKPERLELIEDWLAQAGKDKTAEEWAAFVFVREGWAYALYERDRVLIMEMIVYDISRGNLSGYTPAVNPCLDQVFDECDWELLTAPADPELVELAAGVEVGRPPFLYAVMTREMNRVGVSTADFTGRWHKVVFSWMFEPVYLLERYSDFRLVFPSDLLSN